MFLLKKVWTVEADVLHTFNVYDDPVKMYADMNHAKYYQGYDVIECSGKCKECMICYPKYNSNNTRYMIFELTKRTKRRKINAV